MTTYSDQPELEKQETQSLKLLYGTYADVLFVLLPFAVVAIFKAWDQGVESVLIGYDLSMAAGVLGGLAVVKFIMGHAAP